MPSLKLFRAREPRELAERYFLAESMADVLRSYEGAYIQPVEVAKVADALTVIDMRPETKDKEKEIADLETALWEKERVIQRLLQQMGKAEVNAPNT